MKTNIIGRHQQIDDLESHIGSPKSEFVAIYGRRRVGKTFLVKELFENQFYLRVTGKDNVKTREQLSNFNYAISDQLGIAEQATNWTDAFRLIEKHIDKTTDDKAKILFFDELPWFDTKGSDFVSALEHFWNDWASYRHDIKLIACGSATTWMLDKVINSRGGLHNRVTHKMLLSPFNLSETEEYFHAMGFPYGRAEIIDCYMAMGGVAYYLSLFNNKKSVAENIQRLCFTDGGEMTDEFDKLFKSIFKKAEQHTAIVTALKDKGMGMTRIDLLNATHMPNNGNFSRLLSELEQCGFIRSYSPYGKTSKDKVYQLIDPFTLFYFKFMHAQSLYLDNHWIKLQSTPAYHSWCGHAFEMVCLHHINQIVKALGIDGCINIPCSWAYRPSQTVINDPEADEALKHGAQIDLLIDRSDNVINLCEMKYSNYEYEIDKAYFNHLNRRIQTFKRVTKTRKSVTPIFITSQGLYKNQYGRQIVREVKGDDLFG